MNKIKKRAQKEQTTPLLVLEDHELRLRYIEKYINDRGDYLSSKKSTGLSVVTTKKRAGEQLTPLLILEDHETRLRNIESYIKDDTIIVDNKEHQYQKDIFNDDVEESFTNPPPSVCTYTPPEVTHTPTQKPKIATTITTMHNKKDSTEVGSAKSDDFKSEITFILSRIGDLLSQMR